MRTEFFVEYNLYDTIALQDAREEAAGNAPFGNLGLMKENTVPPAYGTLEHNFFVLDGSRAEFPDSPPDIAYFSAAQAGQDGNFPEGTSVRVRFTEKHTSVGLTLHFTDEPPLALLVTWYSLDGGVLDRRRFYPDSTVYFCANQVEDYGGLDITFLEAMPFHNAKLQYIEYGTKIVWGSDTIRSGTLVNGTDPVSDRIPTDTLSFEFVDRTDSFNIGNAGGIHRTLQKRQSMTPYGVVDGEKAMLGVFFLDSNSTTKNVSRISAIDYKGMLANTDFREGRIYNGEEAGSIIGEIMGAAGITDYEVDEGTAATPLYGTLKIQTCQKALREVLFACGSTINTSRRAGIEIHKINRTAAARIPRGRKFSTTLETDHYVSDVNVKYKTWKLDDKVGEITKGFYGVGTHTIQLSSPAAEMSTNVGRIVKQMPYYVVLEIPSPARTEVVVTGRKYVGEELAVLSSVEKVKSGEVRNTKSFTGTLLDFGAAKAAADRILDYYQMQQIIQTRHLSAHEKAGDWVEVENTSPGYGNFMAGIESMTTDLAGGFISTAKYRGYYKLTSAYYYAGGEVSAGDETGII